MIEALASGKPVVATRSGGPEEIIDESVGIVVEPGDSEMLADAIRRIDARYNEFQPEKLAEFGNRRYSLDTVARRIGDVYAEIADPAAGAPV